MSYEEWYDENKVKKEAVVAKLKVKGYSNRQIIEYFDFDNMRKLEPDFCPLYTHNTKCHELEKLNCYLCACPFFSANGKDALCVLGFGCNFVYQNRHIQDCTHCVKPHTDVLDILKERLNL